MKANVGKCQIQNMVIDTLIIEGCLDTPNSGTLNVNVGQLQVHTLSVDTLIVEQSLDARSHRPQNIGAFQVRNLEANTVIVEAPSHSGSPQKPGIFDDFKFDALDKIVFGFTLIAFVVAICKYVQILWNLVVR